jgi:hypothetical protein
MVARNWLRELRFVVVAWHATAAILLLTGCAQHGFPPSMRLTSDNGAGTFYVIVLEGKAGQLVESYGQGQSMASKVTVRNPDDSGFELKIEDGPLGGTIIEFTGKDQLGRYTCAACYGLSQHPLPPAWDVTN